MYYFGTSLIAAAIACAIASSVLFIQVIRGRTHMLRWGRLAVFATFGLAAAAAGLILALFIFQRYDIRYVYDYSSKELEMRYRIAAAWAGQPGSLMVWAVTGLFAAPFLIKRTRHFEPYALTMLMLLHALLLVFALIRNPFSPTLDGSGIPIMPLDGRGLNPQLHNVWMVIHPPTLFAGYALLGVPFVLALAGLWRRDYDGWVRLALPWTLAGWGVLGLALTMGGYWAYESLGWGGYWGWDPVENSSLVPWLVCTALLHGLVLQRTHGGLRRTNFVLAVVAYVMVFYASFLTRSGVLSNFSVHSFVEEGLKQVMIGALVGLMALGGAMLMLRWRDIPIRRLSDALLSRDAAILLMILAFVVIAVVVGVGTSIPWISSAKGVGYTLQEFFSRVFPLSDGSEFGGAPLQDGRFSLTADFFERTTPPLTLVIVALTGVGPLFGWGNTNVSKFLRSIRWPALIAVVVTIAAIIVGVHSAMSIAFVLLATFSVSTNTMLILRTLRSGWLRIGGYVAHVGVGLLLLGVVGSYVYASEDVRMVIPQGEAQRIYGHDVRFWGYDDTRDNGRHGIRLEVSRGADTFIATPELYYNERMSAWTRTPAIKRYLWEDLYISPEEYLPAEDPNTATLVPNQEARIGPYAVRFQGFRIDDQLDAAAVATVGASVTITDTRTSAARTVEPSVRMAVDKPFEFVPVDLGGGNELYLDNFVPGAKQVVLRVQGLNIPIKPARAVLQVGVKPAIALVWLGALLIALGCGLAVVRRAWKFPRTPRSAHVANGDGAVLVVGDGFGVVPHPPPGTQCPAQPIGNNLFTVSTYKSMTVRPFNPSSSTGTNQQPNDDLYALLQVAPTASHIEIEASYQRLSAMYSVERLQDGPPEFQQLGAMRREELAAAYAVLGNPDQRAVYDAARTPSAVEVPLDYRPLPPAGRKERPSPSLALPPVGGDVAVRRVARGPRSLVAPILIGATVLAVLLVIVLSGVRVDGSPEALATPAVAQLTLPFSPEQIANAQAQAESANTADAWVEVGHMYFDNMGTLREAAPLSPQYMQSLPQWMEAVNAYQRALELGAGPSVRADMALAQFYHGVSGNDQPSVTEAFAQVEQARKDGPDDPRVLLSYGMMMFSSSPPREDEGRAAFQRILEVAPQSFEARSAQALLGTEGQ